MTTQPTEAVGSDAQSAEPTDPADYFKNLAELEFGVSDEQEEQPAEGAEEQSEATEEADDEPTLEEEADDLPPIEAPVSWDAEAKEVFKTLPREAQEIVQKREAEREKFVQAKSQEATQAKQTAVSEASAQLAQIEQGYAQQYQQAAAVLDQLSAEPDYSLLATNPAEFARQAEIAKHFRAQRDAAQQNAQQYQQQAQARMTQIEQATQAEQHRIIVENFPEYADPTTGPELQRKLTAAAKRIGYSDELIASARATDIIAMRTVAEALEKADKYDALQKTKMQKVREAKGKPPVSARPGVSQGPEASKARNATQLKEVLTSTRNREVQGQAFYELAKSQGWVS